MRRLAGPGGALRIGGTRLPAPRLAPTPPAPPRPTRRRRPAVVARGSVCDDDRRRCGRRRARAAARPPAPRCRRPARPRAAEARGRAPRNRPTDRVPSEQVVERRAAAGALQPVDAAVAAVVEHGHDQLAAQHHRRLQLGVHHQVAAVADHDEHLAARDAPASRQARRRSRSPCRKSRIRRDSRRGPACATACAARPAGRRPRRPRRRRAAPPGSPRRAPGRRSAAPRCPAPSPRRPPRSTPPSAPPRAPATLPRSHGRRAPPSAPRAWRGRRRPAAAAPCLPASNGWMLSWISRDPPGSSAREPVVKSCSRVPTARTRSASRARVFAAELPVTPIAPTARGWSQGSAPLPAWVSATGMPCRAAKSCSVAGRLRIQHAAAGDDQRPLARRSAPNRVRQLVRVRRGPADAVHPACANSATGKSNASACTSWHRLSVTGPHSRGVGQHGDRARQGGRAAAPAG